MIRDNHWIKFYKKPNYSFYLSESGYFDERPELVTGITNLLVLFSLPILVYQSFWFLLLLPFVIIGWGILYIRLPYKTGKQCSQSPAWGVSIHNNTFWIYIGGNNQSGPKWIFWWFPFVTKEWFRTSILLKDGTWEHEFQNKRLGERNKEFWKDEWKEKQASWNYNYTDYDGTVVLTTIYLEEIEWRPKWFQWTNMFALVRRRINVNFSSEIGKEKNSWKGGVIGCTHDLLPNEAPLDCLKRMEKERKF